jgi:hypothetical protein
MLNHQDLISIYAELSLVLAGFVGVASAFSGRERLYRPIEMIRLVHVLGAAGSVLAGCLFFFTASAGGLNLEQSLSAAGVGSALVISVVILPSAGRAWRNSVRSDSTTETWVLWSITIVNILVFVLFLSTVFGGARQLSLICGFSIQLLLGLWVFARLLTRAN